MESSPIQLNVIARFVEVARRQSFSLAARALAMPTSTLSRRIGQLEQAIGLRLINRNTRRLELTNAGTAYLRRCQGLVDEARLAHEHLLALSARPQGRLSISIPYSMAILARKRVVSGKSALVRLDLGGRRFIYKTKNKRK